ncbi:ATP-binding cassette domain-containing protein [Arthrobacter sp. NA-172]|uniref:ATP-binding cassette domain-containing protein n=1 Tax=Arthrobacter sp. NA-172 TaxID=3367524 RepID=UPI0037542A10
MDTNHHHGPPTAPERADDAAGIDIVGLTKRYLTPKNETFTAIRDVTLRVEPGQFCAIVGPTGCGKSTTLAQVSGLEAAKRRLSEGPRPDR